MESKSDSIVSLLRELKSRYPEIDACMVAKKGLEGVILFPESFKHDVSDLWEPLEETIDKVLNVISEEYSYNFERAYVELLGYGVSFHILYGSDTSLILFIKSGKRDVYSFLSKSMNDINSCRNGVIKIVEK